MLRFKTLMVTPPNLEYIEPSTGYRIPWNASIQDVYDAVAVHRKAHQIPMPDGWQAEVEHQLAMTLKVSNPDDWIYDTEKPLIPRLVAYGRQMWGELHARALAYPEAPDQRDKDNELIWLRSWVDRIPSAKCDCAYKWKKMGLDFDISSRAGYYRSTVAVHDAINRSLGKPLVDGEFRHVL